MKSRNTCRPAECYRHSLPGARPNRPLTLDATRPRCRNGERLNIPPGGQRFGALGKPGLTGRPLAAPRAVVRAVDASPTHSLLAPAAFSLLTTTFTHPGERGKAFGIFGAIGVGGGAVGLLLGGVLTEYISWRWCMYINIPIALVAVAGALPLLSGQARTGKAALDIPGHADRNGGSGGAGLRLHARRD